MAFMTLHTTNYKLHVVSVSCIRGLLHVHVYMHVYVYMYMYMYIACCTIGLKESVNRCCTWPTDNLFTGQSEKTHRHSDHVRYTHVHACTCTSVVAESYMYVLFTPLPSLLHAHVHVHVTPLSLLLTRD